MPTDLKATWMQKMYFWCAWQTDTLRVVVKGHKDGGK